MNKSFLFKLSIFSALLLICPQLFSQTNYFNDANYAEYTLENGMQVFVLEDFSSAPVRIEYTVHAGISAQSSSNTGFFKLYTNLFKYGSVEWDDISDLTYECNADSARYITTTTPSRVSRILEQMARHAFAPAFTDSNIQKELNLLKTEVMHYAGTPAAFINSSIDARVFSEAPWKQDSGIYPSLFTKTTPAQARTILINISRTWYTPQNSAIFISGSIKKEAALTLVKNTFGQYGYVVNSSRAVPVKAGGSKRKFVLYDSQFSEDLTQVVIQYTSLDLNQSDLISAVFNQDYSEFKKSLTSQSQLNIRGAEYINTAAAHKNGSSRVIIQSLLEKNKKTPVEQAELFLKTVKEGASATSSMEFEFSKRWLSESFNQVTSNSKTFMEYLSQYWALEQLAENKDSIDSSMLAARMCNRPAEIKNQNIVDIEDLYSLENPFVFVLVNTKTYNKYKTAFSKAGYEPVNSKNGSWYLQKLNQTADSNLQEINNFENLADYDSSEALQKFISESRKSISSFKLKNNIPVTVKENTATSNVVILLSINGGKLADGNRPGFQSVMANAFASNIQTEINRYKYEGILESFPEVLSETLEDKSIISIECIKEDAVPCIRAISEALIYGEIAPADADSYVYSVQTQKRLSDGSPVSQLTNRGIRYLYDSQLYRNIYDSENDILVKTSYMDILASYPLFLNSDLYSIVVTGNTTAENITPALQETLGCLKSQKKTLNSKFSIPKPDFPAKTKKISLKLRHLFYTDVAAEDAGPMPAVLVPTKNFSDPVQYWVPSPAADNPDFLYFNAMNYRFCQFLEKYLTDIAGDIKLFQPTDYVHAASFTILNVDHTAYVDVAWANAVCDYLSLLKDEQKQVEEVENIRNCWIMETLKDTQTNRGTARLIALKQQEYLDNYEKILSATPQEFIKTAESYLLAEPLIRIYSADSKK